MNRNVEALAAILREWKMTPEQAAVGHLVDIPRSMAEYAAARGVLAVDSLTDEQAERAIYCDLDDAYATPDQLRAALRRCATGEGKA